MKIKIAFIFLFMVVNAACTSVQLRQSTLAQGGTLTDLQYTMVLDNVAMFRQASGSLPWHLKITSGSVTINDSLNPNFSYTGSPSKSQGITDDGITNSIAHTITHSISRVFGINASRSWQEGWTVVPVIDQCELLRLQRIYQAAINEEWIENGFPPNFVFAVSGSYHGNWVWVKQENLGKLTNLVMKVLDAAPPKAGERGMILQGPVQNIR